MFRISPLFFSSLGMSGSQVAGATGSFRCSLNEAIAGPRTKYDMTAPAIIRHAIRGPMRNPTPINSGDSSPATAAPLSPDLAPLVALTVYSWADGSDDHSFAAAVRNLWTRAIPNPTNTILAVAPPFSPATRTSAHAVPSG